MHPNRDGGVDYELNFWYNDGTWTKVGPSGRLDFSEEWHQYGVTYDGKVFRLYLDGEEVATHKATTGPAPFPKGGQIRFANDTPGGQAARFHTGAIDECLIADEALPETVIKESMEKGIENTSAFRDVFAVANRDKLATTWGRMKLRY